MGMDTDSLLGEKKEEGVGKHVDPEAENPTPALHKARSRTAPAASSSAKGDGGDKTFTVLKPTIVHGTKRFESSYYKYTVEVRVKRVGWPEGKQEVSRRYSDFVSLRQMLVDAHPGVIVPTLPDKELVGIVEKFIHVSDNFMEYRRRLLDRFLNNAARNEVLMDSQQLRDFAALDEKAWEERSTRGARWRMPAGVRDSMSKAMARSGIAAIEGVVPEQHQGLYKYLCTIENGLSQLKKAIETQLTIRHEAFQAFDQIGDCMQQLGEIEGGVDNVLRGDLLNVGRHAKNLGSIGAGINTQEKYEVLDTVTYYTHMMASIRANLYDQKRLETVMGKKHKEKAAAEKKRDDHAAKGEEEKKERQQEAALALGKDIEDLERLIETVSAQFSDQLVVFRKIMGEDWAHLMGAFVNLRVTHAFSELTTECEPILPCMF